ncbi:SDR family oxidoreductase [Allopusillimonas soli]|uniref:SDR family oxidoreductase n=1 Tax=Allopusillimonas soli TaxID=659016 RepID=A0A853FEN9_9BURK|nr:SDR family oxidoreductase [Allopusillimonas soli]NYT36506.1 SDR family oxidoreductase [Allopusillimonas soli]TEA75009.1 SDR family oxidoreductase [Allopusillimonas soli]
MSINTVAIITGASRGLGREIARQLLAPENCVITMARSHDAELVAEAAKLNAKLQPIQSDLANPAAAQRAAMQIANALPEGAQRYLLINNAGMVDPVSLADGLDQPAAITAAFSLNVTSVMLLTAAFLKAVKPRQADSRIVNISSGAGRNATTGWGVYCATKAALDHYTNVLAAENHGVRVVSLAPGVVDTGMQQAIRSASPSDFPNVDRFAQMHDKGQLASPQDTAARILRYIARDDFGSKVLDDIRQYD